jgi:hypothetical protein
LRLSGNSLNANLYHQGTKTPRKAGMILRSGGFEFQNLRLTCFVFFGQCCGLFWRVPGEPADVETAA